MKYSCKVKIVSKEVINEMPNAWTDEDYKNLLDLFGYSEAMSAEEVKDMLYMAISDESPEDSAEIILKYRLGKSLTEGQIKQLSHEMQEDKISEEYPDIFLQHELYNVNQLLFKAFNGRFPNAKAIEADMELTINSLTIPEDENRMNEVILKVLKPALGDHSVINRLYEDELKSENPFTDADGIIWNSSIKKESENSFKIKIISSEYWLHDLPDSGEYETDFEVSEEEVTA